MAANPARYIFYRRICEKLRIEVADSLTVYYDWKPLDVGMLADGKRGDRRLEAGGRIIQKKKDKNIKRGA